MYTACVVSVSAASSMARQMARLSFSQVMGTCMRPLPSVVEQSHAGRGRVGRVQVGDDLLDRVAVFQAVFG